MKASRAPRKFPLPERPVLLYKLAASSHRQKELFCERFVFLAFEPARNSMHAAHPQQRAACMLLSGIVGRYIEEFDEAPLPSAVADRAYSRLLDAVAELNPTETPAEQLTRLNRLAALRLAQ
jgi:hypothetical protein